MKYIVRKPIPGAKVDQILEVGNGSGNLYYEEDVLPGPLIVLHENQVRVALDQGFIEPYEEKPKRWRAGEGEAYHVVGGFADPQDLFNDGGPVDDSYYNSGNQFRSRETATAVAEALKLFFEWLHTPLEVTASKESKHWADMYDAMNKARELVLADNEAK